MGADAQRLLSSSGTNTTAVEIGGAASQRAEAPAIAKLRKESERLREQLQPRDAASAGSKGSLTDEQQQRVDFKRFRAMGKKCGASEAYMQEVDKEIGLLAATVQSTMPPLTAADLTAEMRWKQARLTKLQTRFKKLKSLLKS